MPHKLINHSPDLKQLWDEGLELEIKDDYLLIHHVPYLNHKKEVKYGILASTLNHGGGKALKPETHAIYFIGDKPCHKDGSFMSGIINNSVEQQLTRSIRINHFFSTKPGVEGYPDYYQKITTYINLLSAPAKSLDDSVTEKTFKVIKSEDTAAPFNYADSNSLKGEVHLVTQKLEGQKVAVIGLGGTGSYVLDLIAKTPVQEIHLYDGDKLKQHNAFRAPGAPSIGQLEERIFKTVYLKGIYSNMHRGIHSHPEYIDSSNMEALKTMEFVFICLDQGEVKRELVSCLEEWGVAFIDVGIGVLKVNDELIGQLRITTSSKGKRDHVRQRVAFSKSENNEYSTNIQIADLNMLNASLAVIKWKKLYGFYQDLEKENNTIYVINTGQLINDDHEA